jgi:dihydrofolate synthase/folylpolyglutamate synthase
MNYRDALDYMYRLTDYEKRGFATYTPEFYNLDRVHQLLALLGDPHHRYPSIHIAGTKGKGSTAAMIESVLREAGYRTGLYTSPHLHTFRERIRAGARMIPEEAVSRLIASMQPLVDQVENITTFEVMTCLAFLWFAEQQIDWAVVEVGMGGRLDATNVLLPEVSVITSLSLDHTTILGDTLAKIAAEKAGIIKPGVPVISAPQEAEALAVIESVCAQETAPLTLVGRDWTFHGAIAAAGEGQEFSVRRGAKVIPRLHIPLLGAYQIENATTALAALWTLRRQGASIPLYAIRRGLSKVHWPGRLEILNETPLVVADSAHNGDSAQKLVATLKDQFAYKRLILILGASADHASPELLTTLLSAADWAIATRAQHPRAADPTWLQEQARQLGYEMVITDSIAAALDQALAQASPDDLICGTGSIFVVAEMRAAWLARQGLPLPPVDPV